MLQPALLAPDGLVFLRDGLCLRDRDEADAIADGREPLVGVVLRCSSRYSLREVMMRYGSSVPFVTRSSMRVPM